MRWYLILTHGATMIHRGQVGLGGGLHTATGMRHEPSQCYMYFNTD